jgi:hypothetical protein
MDLKRRRDLKKLGKREVERRSAELREVLRAANPSPLRSDEWARGYKIGTERDRWLRKKLPLLNRDEVISMFVVLSQDDPGWIAHSGSTGYVLCGKCGSAAPSVLPKSWFYWARCECGNIRLRRILFWERIFVREPSELTPLKLIGRA